MKLHLLDRSPNCRKVLATINQLNLDIDCQPLDLFSGETKSDAFMAINPFGKTPTLVDGDFILWESNAITQYLADKSSDNQLLPSDAKSRANITRWQFWEACHYGRAVGDILWEKFAKEVFSGEKTDEEALADALNRFHQCAPILEQQLEKNDFVCGDKVSLADFSLACHAAFFGNL